MEFRGADTVTAAAYDQVAASYAAILPDDRYEAALDRSMIADFAQRVADTTGRRVVDAGSGAGRMVPVLARYGLDYVGVDLSPVMVRTAQRLHPQHHFLTGALADLPLPDESADGILAWYSIIHTEPTGLPAILAEVRRVLRPGGLLLLAFQAGTGERPIRSAYGHDVELTAHLHEPTHVQQQLGALDFTIEATLIRGPRASEREEQAMILARSAASVSPGE